MAKKVEELFTEEQWIEKLEKLEEEHNKKMYLTPEGFNKLADDVLHYIRERTPQDFGQTYVIHCMEENDHCTIKCQKEIDKFINNITKLQVRKQRETFEKLQEKKN